MHDTNLLEDQPIAWTPTPDVIERAQLTKFMRQVGVSTWNELYQFSIRDVEKFTEEVLKFLDIRFDPPYEKLLDASNGIEFPNWFLRNADTPVRNEGEARTALSPQAAIADEGVRVPAGLNVTEMCLDRWNDAPENRSREAIVWRAEDPEEEGQDFSYGELLMEVESCAAGLRTLGFVKGDAIGLHLPMIPETVVALLGINRIGAVAVPVFSGYGVEAVASRLKAVGAKGLFAATGFHRRGKMIDSLSVSIDAVKSSPSVEHLIVVENYGRIEAPEVSDRIRITAYLDLLDRGDQSEFSGEAAKTSAEDPLIILYTSGTTGKPKGIAHTHASFPIKAAQDMAFGTDVGRGTRISWYTDIGWMMGPWLIYGALINGATICIYDGAPDYPTPDRMWEFCAKHKVEVLGISPTLIRSLAASEDRSADTLVRMDAASASRHADESSHLGKNEALPQRRGWYRHKLPHFDGTVTQFITFRLADSLPASVLDRLRLQLAHDKLDDDSEEFRQKVEEYLDAGAGSCILRDPGVAEVVQETILYEHGRSCDLKAWVIMPNHAHLLLRLYEGHDLAGLMKRIKGVSARKINELRSTDGTVWQADYFDRYIRDGEHFSKTLLYIERNPVLAKLCSSPNEYQFSSAFLAASGDADRSVRAPFERHDLSALRIFASTGEPWNPAPWWWLFEKVGNSKLPIINYSGGTEISGGILMGNPLLPIKPCSFPAPCPGMDVDILDEEGQPVEAGKVGELVIKQPWIGMARGFWQEKERYLETYWRRFKNIWVHGDWAMRDKDGHWFILGRSDDTLKVAGKRVGPAEVESLLVAHPLVTEAAVIGVPDARKGTAMIAFCVLSGASDKGRGASEDESSDSSLVTHHSSLETELKALVSRDMGKPLAPSKIHFVSALPKTRNAKVMRRVIRSAYLGDDPGDLSALENPKSVEELAEIRLRS